MEFQAGKSGDFAEIIVDYKKKDVKLLNPENPELPVEKRKLKDTNLDFSFFFYFFVCVFFLFSLSIFTHDLSLFAIGSSVAISFFAISILLTSIKRKYHKYGQYLQVDFLYLKKVVIIKSLKSKVYQLPYEFFNNKLDIKFSGDFLKYRSKLHIKPKEYYLKRYNKKHLQQEYWDCFVYFDKVPKKGKMEIEFV